MFDYADRPIKDVQIANLSLLSVPEYAHKVLVGTAADPRPFTLKELQALLVIAGLDNFSGFLVVVF